MATKPEDSAVLADSPAVKSLKTSWKRLTRSMPSDEIDSPIPPVLCDGRDPLHVSVTQEETVVDAAQMPLPPSPQLHSVQEEPQAEVPAQQPPSPAPADEPTKHRQLKEKAAAALTALKDAVFIPQPGLGPLSHDDERQVPLEKHDSPQEHELRDKNIVAPVVRYIEGEILKGGSDSPKSQDRDRVRLASLPVAPISSPALRERQYCHLLEKVRLICRPQPRPNTPPEVLLSPTSSNTPLSSISSYSPLSPISSISDREEYLLQERPLSKPKSPSSSDEWDREEATCCGLFNGICEKPYKTKFTERRNGKLTRRRCWRHTPPTDTIKAADEDLEKEEKQKDEEREMERRSRDIDAEFRQMLKELELRIFDALLLAGEVVEREEDQRFEASKRVPAPCKTAPVIKLLDAGEAEKVDTDEPEPITRTRTQLCLKKRRKRKSARRRFKDLQKARRDCPLPGGVHEGVLKLVVVPPRVSSLQPTGAPADDLQPEDSLVEEDLGADLLEPIDPPVDGEPPTTDNENQAPESIISARGSVKGSSKIKSGSATPVAPVAIPQLDGAADDPDPVVDSFVPDGAAKEHPNQYDLKPLPALPGATRLHSAPHRHHHRKKLASKDQLREKAQPKETKSNIVIAQPYGYHKHTPARDWPPFRKRWTASVACLSTTLIGILVGMYPALATAIEAAAGAGADGSDKSNNHLSATLSNAVFFGGLTLSTFLFWPLPLLHGRKPYVLASLAVAELYMFYQGAATSQRWWPAADSRWRAFLFASRGLMGCALGFASVNFHAALLDLFGASLHSAAPYQEVVRKEDDNVRHRGGGMGLWLGMWTACWLGATPLGYLAGRAVREHGLHPAWGFCVGMVATALVFVLNALSPETRRAPFRTSVVQLLAVSSTSTREWHRLGWGEVMMHRTGMGAQCWVQEAYHGVLLSLQMMLQPGFLCLTVYAAWLYAQVVLLVVILGEQLAAGSSKYIALGVSLAGAGLVAASLQKKAGSTSSTTSWVRNANVGQWRLVHPDLGRRLSSRTVRRTAFLVCLPLAFLAYYLTVEMSALDVGWGIAAAFFVVAFSCLAVAECHGWIMETFDVSDLEPKMSSSVSGSELYSYSSFPRVTAGFAVMHTLAYLFAAVASALGGLAQYDFEKGMVATRAAMGILAGLHALLIAVVIRFRRVRVVPDVMAALQIGKLSGASGAHHHHHHRRRYYSDHKHPSSRHHYELEWLEPSAASGDYYTTKKMVWDLDAMRPPLVLGCPAGVERKMNILELGAMTRWSEIRRKNHLVDLDAGGRTGAQYLGYLGGGDSTDERPAGLLETGVAVVATAEQQGQHGGGAASGASEANQVNDDGVQTGGDQGQDHPQNHRHHQQHHDGESEKSGGKQQHRPRWRRCDDNTLIVAAAVSFVCIVFFTCLVVLVTCLVRPISAWMHILRENVRLSSGQ